VNGVEASSTNRKMDLDELGKMIEAYEPVENMYFVLANQSSSSLYERQKGNWTIDTNTIVFSSSKWIATTAFMKLIDMGIISLDHYVHQYLSYWSSDPSDPRSQVTIKHLLSFSSGFEGQSNEPECIGTDMELQDCAKSCYDNGLFIYPPGTFRYGSIHLQFCGAIIEEVTGMRYIEYFQKVILEPLKMTNTFYEPSTGNNPPLAWGLLTSVADYNRFLGAYFEDNIISSDLRKLMESDYTPNRRDLILVPGYHYGFGNWFECDITQWSDDCYEEDIHSAQGAAGFYPLVNRQYNYYFFIGTNIGFLGASRVLDLKDEIKAFLAEYFSNK